MKVEREKERVRKVVGVVDVEDYCDEGVFFSTNISFVLHFVCLEKEEGTCVVSFKVAQVITISLYIIITN